MDGSKNLAQIIREAEYECDSELPEEKIQEYLDAVRFLIRHGYFGQT